MECWRKMMLPLQRLCSGVASRFRFRKTGLLVLHREVKACEYEDVQVMWEMLRKSESGLSKFPGKAKNKHFSKIFRWARFAHCIRTPFQMSKNSQDWMNRT